MVVIKTKGFSKDAKRLRLKSIDLEALEQHLTLNPESGDRVEGLRGLRKVRFGIPSRKIGKSEKSDLSKDDRDTLAALLDQLLEEDDGEN